MCDDCLITRREAAGLVKMLRENVDSDARRLFVEQLVYTLKDASGDVEIKVSDDEVDRILWEIEPQVQPAELSAPEWDRLDRLAEAGLDDESLSIFAAAEFDKDVHPSVIKDERQLAGVEPEAADRS